MLSLDALHGNRPAVFQLVATYGVGFAAAALVLTTQGFGWRSWLLALVAADWCGGVVANAAAPVRAWWTARPRMKTGFVLVHLAELPLIYWLSGGGVAFYILAVVLAAKLSVFMLGQQASARQQAA